MRDRLKALPTEKREIVEQILRNLVKDYHSLQPQGVEHSIKYKAQLNKILAEAAGDLRKKGELDGEVVTDVLEAFTGMQTRNCSLESVSSGASDIGPYSDEKMDLKEGDCKSHITTEQINERVKTVSGRLMSFIHFIKSKKRTSPYKHICCRKMTHTIEQKSTSSSCEELEVYSFRKAERYPLQSSPCAPVAPTMKKRFMVDLAKVSRDYERNELALALKDRHKARSSFEKSDHRRLLLEQAQTRLSESDHGSSPSVANVHSFSKIDSPIYYTNLSQLKSRSSDLLKPNPMLLRDPEIQQ